MHITKIAKNFGVEDITGNMWDDGICSTRSSKM